MTDLQEFRDDFPLFLEGGFIAIKQGDEESAKKLFNAIEVLDPQNTSKKMGYGLIALHKMDFNVAKNNFEEILKVEPENWRVKSFLAFALYLEAFHLGGSLEESEKIFLQGSKLAHEVVEKGDEPSARQLAESLIDWEKEITTKWEKEKSK